MSENLFKLKKELKYTAIIDIRNLFILEKETRANIEEYLEILKIFLSMKKKKKININR